MKQSFLYGLLLAGCCTRLSVRGEDRTNATLDAMIGGLFFSNHSYLADTHVHVPIWTADDFTLSYEQHEVTPVFKEHAQTQLLETRNRVEVDYQFTDDLRAIGIGGFHHMGLEDRSGSLGAYELGAGIGSAVTSELPTFEWSVVAGGYLSRQRLDSDWWADLHGVWRFYEFPEGKMLDSTYQPSLGLALDVESSNKGGKIRALYRVGPVLDVMSANGNRVRFRVQWYDNDRTPFLEKSYSALFVGVEVSTSLDDDKFNMRTVRTAGWLPMVWGEYDAGYSGDRTVQRTELDAEIHDFRLDDHLFTAVLNYESRQEFRTGDYNNASYTISFGLQSEVGLASPLSQGQQLVAGIDYLHRSAHAVDPSIDRAPPGTTLVHDSLNLAPRLRLQTRGWDLPYRDPSIYSSESRWLNNFDWRVTFGYDFYHSRHRSDVAAQFGLNWDAATLGGCVIYARGLESIGDETPDWLAEVGVRRKIGKLFFRFERYGLERQLAQGDTIMAGIGFHL